MKKTLLAITGVMLTGSMAFASLEEDVAFLNGWSGNGPGSRIITYDPAKLDATAIAKELYGDLADGSCYSSVIQVIEAEYESQEMLNRRAKSSVSPYINMLKRFNNYENAEIEKLDKTVRSLVADKSNKLVVTTGFDRNSEDSSEACLIYRYRVYRADGRLVEIEFNETD